MEFDWFTFVAQVVNFFILVVLLKRFLYKPITGAMDAREKRIASRLEQAEQSKQQAEEQEKLFTGKQKELDDKREQYLQEAKTTAENTRKEMMEEIRKRLTEEEKEWRTSLEEKQQTFLSELEKRTLRQVMLSVKKGLSELAGQDLEARVIEQFKAKLAAVDDSEKKEFVADIQAHGKRLVVRTAFELDEQQQSTVHQMVKENLTDGIQIEFENSPALVCGIELRTEGKKLAWHAGQFAEELRNDVQKVLEQHKSASQERSETPSE